MSFAEGFCRWVRFRERTHREDVFEGCLMEKWGRFEDETRVFRPVTQTSLRRLVELGHDTTPSDHTRTTELVVLMKCALAIVPNFFSVAP
jgi:hypothetical protein